MDENSPEAQFNRMMEQNAKQKEQRLMSGQQGQGQRPQTQQSFEEQRVLNTVQASVPTVTPITPTHGQCPQCGMLHPPLQPGEKCGSAPAKIEGVPEVSITDFIIKVKDILTSQMEQKSVKDFKKFSGGLIITLMKYCEEYKE